MSEKVKTAASTKNILQEPLPSHITKTLKPSDSKIEDYLRKKLNKSNHHEIDDAFKRNLILAATKSK